MGMGKGTRAAKGKRKRGRPEREINLHTVRALAGQFATMAEIANALGVARSVLQLRAKAVPAVREAIEQGRCDGRTSIRGNLFRMMLKDPRVAIHMAKTYLPDREQAQRVEHSGGLKIHVIYGAD